MFTVSTEKYAERKKEPHPFHVLWTVACALLFLLAIATFTMSIAASKNVDDWKLINFYESLRGTSRGARDTNIPLIATNAAIGFGAVGLIFALLTSYFARRQPVGVSEGRESANSYRQQGAIIVRGTMQYFSNAFFITFLLTLVFAAGIWGFDFRDQWWRTDVVFIITSFATIVFGALGTSTSAIGVARTAAAIEKDGVAGGLRVGMLASSATGLAAMSLTLIILGGMLMVFGALRFFAGGIAAASLVSAIFRFWGGLSRGAAVGNAINKGSNADSPSRFADLISEHIVNVGAAGVEQFESFFLAIAGAMILGPYPYGQDGSAAPLWFGGLAVISNFVGVLLLRVAVVEGKSRAQMFQQAANTPRAVVIAVTLLNIAFAPLVATQHDLGWRAYVSYVIGAATACAISLHIGFVTNYGEDNKKELAEAPTHPGAQLLHRLGLNFRSTFFPTAALFLAVITTMVLGQNHDAKNGTEVRRSNVDYMPAIMTIGFVSIAGVMTTLQSFAAVADNALALVSTSPHSDEAGEAALATDDVGAAGAAMARAFSGAASLLVAHTIIRCFVQSVFSWYKYPIQGRKTGVIFNVPYNKMEFTGLDSVFRQPSDQIFFAMDPLLLPEYTINFDEKRALIGLLAGATLPFLIGGYVSDGYAFVVERVSKAGNEEGDNIAVVIKDLSTGLAGKGLFPVFLTIAITAAAAFGCGPYMVVPLCIALAVIGYVYTVTLNSNADDAAKRYVEAAEGNPDADAAQAALIVGSFWGDVQKDTVHGAVSALIKFVPAVLLLLAPGIIEACDKTVLYESHCFSGNARSNLVEYGF